MRSTWMRGTSLRWLICSYVEHDGGAPPPPVGADGGAVAGHRLHLPLGVMPRRVEALAREPGRGDVHGNESLRIVKVERVAQKMDEPLRGVRAAARHGPLPQRVNAGLIEPRLARGPKLDRHVGGVGHEPIGHGARKVGYPAGKIGPSTRSATP